MKASGDGFFAGIDTRSYAPRGVLLGQAADDSCVPACVRMLLLDEAPERIDDYQFSESFLRARLETTSKGSVVSSIPFVLQDMGVIQPYIFRTDMTLDDLRRSVQSGYAIVVLRTDFPKTVHVMLIEELTDEMVAVRDPLPMGQGSSYMVELAAFLSAWEVGGSNTGCAVVVLE